MTLSDRLAEWDAVARTSQESGWAGPDNWYLPNSTVWPDDEPEDMAYIALASPARFRALLNVARAAANYSKTEADWAQAIIEARADVDAAAARNISAVDELDDALERLREVAGV